MASIGECMIELRHRKDVELELGFGGDTLNFAVYLARLTRERNVRVDYVSALGDDEYSEQMLAFWQSEGLGCEHVARLEGRLPALYTIRVDAEGERTFTYWRSASAARDMLRDGRAGRLEAALADHDLLYFSGITLSILSPDQRQDLCRLFETLRARGAKIAFDSNFRRAGWPDLEVARAVFDDVLRRTDIALPTLSDEHVLFGVEAPPQCAARLHALGIAEVVIKLGKHGCYLSSEQFTGLMPAEPVERVVDSTAAGDSLNAGYLAARLLGRDPEAAGRLGNRLAARVISHRGAVIPAEAMADVRL